MADKTRFAPSQSEALPCPCCHSLFQPKRPTQRFCSARCRASFHTDVGASGKVASVRRIRRGCSVVIHLAGPAAEAALQLHLAQIVRLVVAP